MKKLLTMILALSLMLLIMFTVACGKNNNPTGNSATITPAATTSLTPVASPSPTQNLDKVDAGVDDIEDLTTVVDITAKIKNSSGTYLSSGSVTFTLEDGSALNSNIQSNNEIDVSGTPKNVTVSMVVKDTSGKELVSSSFKLWDGYDLNAYDNEEGNIDIDVPSDAETLFMVFSIKGDVLECTYINQKGF